MGLFKTQFGNMYKHTSVKPGVGCVGRLGLVSELKGHKGCVNRLVWSDDGNLLASVSDDCDVRVWDFGTLQSWMRPLSQTRTGHSGNIFGVRFLPGSGNATLITGAMDGEVRVHMPSLSERASRLLHREPSAVLYVDVAHDAPCLVWSASEAGHVRQFDLREPSPAPSCGGNTIIAPRSVCRRSRGPLGVSCNSVRVSPSDSNHLLVACGDAYARLYDRRRLPPVGVDGPAAFENVLLFAPLHVADEVIQPPAALQALEQRRAARSAASSGSSIATPKSPVGGGALCRGSRGSTYAEFDDEGRTILMACSANDGVFTFDVHAGMSGASSSLPEFQRCLPSSESQRCLPSCGSVAVPDAVTTCRSVWRPVNHSPTFSAATEALKGRGNAALKAGHAAEALVFYTQALLAAETEAGGRVTGTGSCVMITNSHGVAVLRCNRALAWLKRSFDGDAADAARDCAAAVRLSPGFLKPHVRLAKTLHDCGHSLAAADGLAALVTAASAGIGQDQGGKRDEIGEILDEARRLLEQVSHAEGC